MNDVLDVLASLMLLAQQYGDSRPEQYNFAGPALWGLIITLFFRRASKAHPRRSGGENGSRNRLVQEINVGIECYERGEYDQAESLLRPAIRKADRIAPRSTDTAGAYRVLALICLHRRSLEEAESLARHALAIYEPIRRPLDRDVVLCRLDLVWCCTEQGRFQEAEAGLRELLPALARNEQPDSELIILTLYRLSRVRQLQGDLPEAEKLLVDALRLYDGGTWKSDQSLYEILRALATVCRDRGRYAESAKALQRMADALKENLGPEDPAVADALLEMSWALLEDQSYHRAEMVCREALGVLRKARGCGHPRVGSALAHLLAVYVRRGQYHEAAATVRDELTILRGAEPGRDRDRLAWWLSNYVDYLRSGMRFLEADQIEYSVVNISEAYGVLFRPERRWPPSRWN